jgi:hypothetical protein
MSRRKSRRGPQGAPSSKRNTVRAGPANVAGVRFQMLVSCALLVGAEAPAGVRAIVPEGEEDIDLFLPEHLIFVQVKHRAGSLKLHEIADALARSASLLKSDGQASLAIVTDAPDAGGLKPTGWTSTLGGQPRLVDALQGRIGSIARRVARRSHLVMLDVDLASIADALQARRPRKMTLVSHLAAALLLARVEQGAAANKSRTAPATSIRVDEVDDILGQAAALLDADEGQILDIERSGTIAAASFRRESQATRAEFLRGVKAQPFHIGSGYAVKRPEAFALLEASMASANAAVIVGPSGAGKSTLMWQYAYETLDRCFTLAGLAPSQVDQVKLFVSLMTPAGAAPLILCADDIGTSRMEGWSALVASLAGDRRVRLLATCREERFSRALTAAGSARVVRPMLSEAEARSIGEMLPLETTGTTPRTAGDIERFRVDADALMLEFVHLATTNRHLADTLGEQCDVLANEASSAAADVLRLVVAADVSGASIGPAELRSLGHTDADLDRAVRRLEGEFVVRENSGALRGLHPLRSHYLLEELHRGLPTIEDTFGRLIDTVSVTYLEETVVSAFRYAQGDTGALEATVSARLAMRSPNDRAAVRMLLRAEAVGFAVRLASSLGADAKHGSYVLRGMLAGSASLQALIARPWDWGLAAERTPQEPSTLVREVERLLASAPVPRALRRSILTSLSPRRLHELLEAADSDVDVLALLYGSDAIAAASARDLVTVLAARASDAALAEAVARLAAVGPRAADGVAQALGAPLPRAEWVLDRLAPVIALEEADGDLVARAAAPPFGSWTELANRIDLIVALTYAVLSDVRRTRVAFRTSADERLDVPIDLTDRSSAEGAAALASPVLGVFENAYARREAELAWSRWLRSTAVAVAEAADDLEVLIAQWHVARSPQSRRDAEAWRSVGEVVDARIRAERTIAAPPTSTGDDELDFFLVELGGPSSPDSAHFRLEPELAIGRPRRAGDPPNRRGPLLSEACGRSRVGGDLLRRVGDRCARSVPRSRRR